jgi:outer membrane lipoprotein-sorting protein
MQEGGFSIMKAKDLKPTVSTALASLLITLLLLLSMTAFAGQETEPNDKLGQANALVSAEAMSGTFGYAGDVDFFKIAVTTPGRLRCSVTRPPANIRSSITLYNRHADYIYVSASAVNDGDDVHLTFDVTEPGTYFIRLQDRDNHVSADPYTFTATFSPVVDAYEPNNDLGLATLATSTTLYGTLFDRSDVDYYRIYAAAGVTLRIHVTSPAEMRTALTLYNPDLAYMYVSGQAVNPGDPLTLEHTVSVAGLYYIRVQDAQGLAHTSAYTLNVTGGNPGFVPPWSPVTVEVEDNGSIGKANDVNVGASLTGSIDPAGV